MVPSSARITSGEPALAQASAQSRLTGFFRFLVNAQAESRTYPFTVAGLPCAAAEAADAKRSPDNILAQVFSQFSSVPSLCRVGPYSRYSPGRQQSSLVSLSPKNHFR